MQMLEEIDVHYQELIKETSLNEENTPNTDNSFNKQDFIERDDSHEQDIKEQLEEGNNVLKQPQDMKIEQSIDDSISLQTKESENIEDTKNFI